MIAPVSTLGSRFSSGDPLVISLEEAYCGGGQAAPTDGAGPREEIMQAEHAVDEAPRHHA